MENYEKVHLQASDVRFLQQQFLRNATTKLQLHLPTPDANDPLKNKVANTLDKFITDAFEMARHAMVVDGVDMSSKENLASILSQRKEKIEPFNFELNDKLRRTYGKVEEETLRVTKLRRELPYRALKEYNDIVKQSDKEIQDLLKNIDTESKELETRELEDDDILISNDSLLPKLSDMINDYEESVVTLSDLKRIIPGQKAELDRLNEIIQFLEESYNKDS